MAKLLTYLPCQKAVAEQGSNNVSIFSVLQEIQVLVPSGQTIPHGGLIPMTWMTVSLWYAEDLEAPFQTKSVLESQSGEVLFQTALADITFEIGDGTRSDNHRVFEQITGFPIWAPGKCWLKLLRKTSEDQFEEVTRAPIKVTYIDRPPQT